MRTIITYSGLVVIAGLWLLSNYVSKRRIGRVGRLLNDSDHQAWQFAVEDKENELAELRRLEP